VETERAGVAIAGTKMRVTRGNHITDVRAVFIALEVRIAEETEAAVWVP
jgi:hypothetical protein